jgi:hypothetical protein
MMTEPATAAAAALVGFPGHERNMQANLNTQEYQPSGLTRVLLARHLHEESRRAFGGCDADLKRLFGKLSFRCV